MTSSVFEEMYRALKPGGRVAVSDMRSKELPEELAQNIAAHVGCIAGRLIAAFASGLRLAGFRDVAVIDTQSDLTLCRSRWQAAAAHLPLHQMSAYRSAKAMQTVRAVARLLYTPDTTDQAMPKPMHADLGELFE